MLGATIWIGNGLLVLDKLWREESMRMQTCQVEFRSHRKKYLTGDTPPCVFISLCLLSAMSWASLIYHILPAMTFRLTMGNSRSNRNQVTLSTEPLKVQWKISPFSLLFTTKESDHAHSKNKVAYFLCPVLFIYLFRFVSGFVFYYSMSNAMFICPKLCPILYFLIKAELFCRKNRAEFLTSGNS